MREVEFRYLQRTLESLNASTDLVLVQGRIMAVLAHQASPYVSHRQVRFDLIPQPLGDNVLMAANYRKVLLAALTEDAVRRAAEAIGADGRPFEGSLLGWDGPWAQWVSEPVPSTLKLLRGVLKCAHDYGLVGSEWLEAPLVYTAWLVPVVVAWDDYGRPVFDWPVQSTESEPVGQDLPVEV